MALYIKYVDVNITQLEKEVFGNIIKLHWKHIKEQDLSSDKCDFHG